ncbi:MAG TPA: hypothetical protein VFK47_18415, partial [Ktedonobacteraceae bacterium]|nr:hypothetical protein [Ktedonobacteraceae bacterium]
MNEVNMPVAGGWEKKALCSLLVLSCDAYKDLWLPFFNQFNTHWADCPYPQYLGVGGMNFSHGGVTALHSNAGRDWSQCFLDYLQQIDTEYVLVMLDDFFLRRKVESRLVTHCLDFAINKQAVQVRLIPRPGPTHGIPGEELIGACAPSLRYRVCAQAAIWNKASLEALLRPGESAWDFETNATERASLDESAHYSVWRSVLPYQGMWAHHVIEKGKWLPHEKWIFSRKNIGCDFAARGTLDLGQTVFCQCARIFQ